MRKESKERESSGEDCRTNMVEVWTKVESIMAWRGVIMKEPTILTDLVNRGLSLLGCETEARSL